MDNSPQIDIESIVKPHQWRAFFDFPRVIYADDPHWVEPLRQTIKAKWDRKNPWFEFGVGRAWLARRGGQVVGTISAQIDRRRGFSQPKGVGYFGHFESIPDPEVARALAQAAANYLRQCGAHWMKGPFDLHINDMCGLLVQGFDAPPSMMMPHHPSYYRSLIEQAGFAEEMRLYAYRIRPDFESPEVMLKLQRRYGSQLVIRPLSTRRFSQEVELLRTLFNDAWQHNWGFVPFSEREFKAIGQELRPILTSRHTAIAELDGRPVGFILALPNLNETCRDFQGRLLPMNWLKLIWRLYRKKTQTARVPLMGVASNLHRTPMGAVAAFSLIDAIRHELQGDGVCEVEMSWILETNEGMNRVIETIGGDRYKEYAIFSKPLESVHAR